MKFRNVREAIEWFVYASASRDSMRSATESVCSILASQGGKPEERTRRPAYPKLNGEKGCIARADIGSILLRCPEADRLALLVFGLKGFRHGAHCMRDARGHEDVGGYLRENGLERPDISGADRRRFSHALALLKRELALADYLRSGGGNELPPPWTGRKPGERSRKRRRRRKSSPSAGAVRENRRSNPDAGKEGSPCGPSSE